MVFTGFFHRPGKNTFFPWQKPNPGENAGMENARMSAMESQNALICLLEALVCVWVHADYLSLWALKFFFCPGTLSVAYPPASLSWLSSLTLMKLLSRTL